MVKKIWCILLTVCLLAGVAPPWARAAVVDSGTCGDNVTWTLDDAGTLTISGSGDMVSYGHSPFNEFRESIKTVVLGNGVTSICGYAFDSCSELRSVTIPNSVTSIGFMAFYDCSNLNNVTIPNSVASIGNNAFYGCSTLTSLTISNGVTSIGEDAFSRCKALTSVTIPDSVNSIGNGAFAVCSGMTSVTIPNKLSKLSDRTFQECSALMNVTIPDSVTSIGHHAFSYCSSLTNVVIPDSVASIGDYAFSNCSGLTSMTIPDSVTFIGNGAFYTCSSLTSVRISNNITSIGDSVFKDCGKLTSVTIPVGVTSIGEYSFDNCSGLMNVSIPNNVTKIDGAAFQSCKGLTSVTISNSVISVGEFAFNNCGSLADVYYNGTQAQWNAIQIAVSNEPLINATIHCTDGDINGNNDPEPSYEIIVPMPDQVTETVVEPENFKLVSNGPYEEFQDLYVDAERKIRDVDYAVFPYNVDRTVMGTYIIGKTITLSEGTRTISLEFKHKDPLGNESVHKATQMVNVTKKPVSDNNNTPSPDEGKATHTVTFDENGGGGFMNTVTVSGSSYTLPENGFSPPYGMRFQAWAVGDSEYPPNTTIPLNSDLTVMALWEPDPTPLAQGYCGADGDGTNLSWTLSRDWHLTIRGTGAMKSYDDSTRAPWYGYHTNISAATLESGVTSIGNAAFTYCAALEEVTLPDTLVSIGDNAFFNCAALEAVELPAGLSTIGNSAFYGCEALTEIALPPRIANMGNYTFAHCANLETVSLPTALTRIGLYAFYDCGSLGSVTVPYGVTTLDIGAFKDCGALRTIAFPAGLTTVNASVFEDCESLYSQSYSGTVSQFEQIAMSLGANNDALKKHVVHCSDGDYDWTPPDRYRILDELQNMDDFQDQIWHLAGPLSEFERFTIDERQLQRSSELLRNGSDYVASEGSTKLNIPAETFRSFGEGSHTAAAEFDNDVTGIETRKQMYTVFPKPGTAKISLREMLGVTGVEKVSYNGRFQSDPVLGDGLYRFVLVSGEIPPGLTLEEGGYFTGVARTAGSYSFEVGLQVKRDNVWPSGYEDTVQITISIEKATEEQIKVVSDPGYEIVKPVPDQITETVMEPENFTLVSNGPYEEFKDLYIDAELKVRGVDYEVMRSNGPTLMDGGAVTGTYIVGKNIKLSAGAHTLSLEFEHKDPLGNTKIHKAAQTFNVQQRSGGGGGSSGGGGGGSSTLYYTITKKKTANGSIKLSNPSAASGTTVTITPTPNKGYQVDKITVTGSNKKNVPVNVSKGIYTFVMPPRRVTVNATFKPANSTTPTGATASVAPTEHGTVKLSSASPAPGAPVTVHTTPEPGYQVMGVTAGTSVKVENVGENVFKFVMPSGGVTVNATFTPKRLAFFTDIQGPDWFFGDAEWAYKRGIILGVTEQIWEPQKEISGVTAIVTLERLDGVNLAPYYNGANDGLDNAAWYVAAARWARNNGIFPANWTITDELPLTRGEYAILLYNFARYRGLNVSAPASIRFSDAALLSEAEYNAFRFLQSVGVFQGYEDGAVRPRTRLSRAQLAALLHRLSEYIISAELSYTRI